MKKLLLSFSFLLSLICAVNAQVPDSGSPMVPNGSSGASGAAGGDLTGTYPNPTVAKVNGAAPGPYATAAQGQLPGIASNTAATVGNIGELKTCSGSAVSLPTGAATNICSIPLTAGDWDCDGVFTTPTQSNNMTDQRAWISPTSATDPGVPNNGAYARFGTLSGGIAMGGNTALAVPRTQILSAGASVFLSALIAYTGTGDTGGGFMNCRRLH